MSEISPRGPDRDLAELPRVRPASNSPPDDGDEYSGDRYATGQ
jgi:hypothetical protein